MERTPAGKIRRLIVGSNPKSEGFSFEVDQQFKGIKITSIVEDLNQFHIFGRVRFLVFAEIKEEEHLWKAFEGVPVTIEYDLYKPENIV